MAPIVADYVRIPITIPPDESGGKIRVSFTYDTDTGEVTELDMGPFRHLMDATLMLGAEGEDAGREPGHPPAGVVPVETAGE